MFSPVDSDIVFTGSADHSIHSWRISKDLQIDKMDLKSELMNFFITIHNLNYYWFVIIVKMTMVFVAESRDTPNIVKEKIVTKDVDSTKTGI